MALGLAGCGGDEPAPVAAPPARAPTPPPFQSEAVEVALGDNGGTLTLMTTEAGGFTLNGEAFTGGADSPIEGEGGRTYLLTLGEDGMWTAAFQPMEVMVQLGSTEETVTLVTTEAGGFTLDGETFAGGTAMNAAGESYTLTLGGEDGMTWTAMHMPRMEPVALGTSGETVTLMTNEAGTWETADGAAVADGYMTTAANGNDYALGMDADGAWQFTFQAQPVEVMLGASGETVTLMTAETPGTFTMDGAPFASGGTAMNAVGESYTLTLGGEDGMTWTAMHVPSIQTVTLGDNGGSVELMTNEAGTWETADGEPFAGGTVPGEGERMYVLTLGEDGMTWTAAFQPMEVMVALGASGETVTLTSTEAGGWSLGASAVIDGYVETAENGDRYRLTLDAEGMWMAAFIPTPRVVDLGGSQETVTLMTTEGGGWSLDDGTPVDDDSVTQNSFGQIYRLSRSADDVWTAMHEPMTQSVRLGTSGMTVELATNEQGRWLQGDASVVSGDRVPGAMNAATGATNLYELTLSGGQWTAEYQAVTMIIAGTGLTAVAREDGTGYTVGEMSLPASGAGEITGPGGAMYRVAKDADGMLAATRFDQPIVGSVLHTNAVGSEGAPSLSGDDPDTDANEAGTMLDVVGASLSMADLLDGGRAQATGPNLVEEARDAMAKIRDRVAALVELRQDDGITSDAFDAQVELQWNAADALVATLFGTSTMSTDDPPERIELLERTDSQNRVVEAFDRVVEALSSEEDFAAATQKNGPRRLLGFSERTAAQARQAFNRVKWTASSTLGVLGSTRFGAAVYNETDHAAAAPGDADRVQGFAWSTMASTMRASDVQTAGSGYYSGSTHAADQEGNRYQGTIGLEVRFAAREVNGLVTQFADADSGEPFTFRTSGPVANITLPTASLERRGSWRVRTGTGEGRLSFVPGVGSRRDVTFEGGRFSGRLLGRGDEAGDEAIGTWRVELPDNTTLAGGFGVERVVRTPPNEALKTNYAQVGGRAAGPASVWLTDSPDAPDLNPGNTKLRISAESLGGSAVPQYVVEVTYDDLVDEDGNPVELPVNQAGEMLVFITFDRYGLGPYANVQHVTRSDITNPFDDSMLTDEGRFRGVHLRVPVQTLRAGVNARVRLRDEYVNFDALEVFELDREKLFSLEYPVTSTDDVALTAQQELLKGTHVSEVRAEIIKQRGRLDRLIALGDISATFANDGRQQIFTAIQAEMRKIFGPGSEAVRNTVTGELIYPGFSTGILTRSPNAAATAQPLGDKWTAWLDYPVNSSNDPQDREVLAEINDVIAALEDFEAFEAAFDTGGVFAGQSGNPVVAAQALSDIYSRPKARLLLWTGTTDFTRFGAWRKQESAFAGAPLIESPHPDSRPSGGTGAFAYSPLDPTQRYLTATQREYPANGSTNVLARYAGSTVAAQNDQFYRGDVEARVQWNAGEVGGDVRVTVSNLRSTDPRYGALQFGRPDLVDPSFLPEVKSLTFAATITTYGGAALGQGNVLGFAGFFNDVVVDVDTVQGGTPRGGTSPLARSYDYATGIFTFEKPGDPDLKVTWAPRLPTQVINLLSDVENYTDVPLVSAAGSPDGNLARLNEAQLNLEVPVALNNVGGGQLAFTYLDGSEEYWTITTGATKPNPEFDLFPSALTSQLEGRFIGNTPSGPVGLIGTWDLNQDSELFGVGSERGPITGAFGAELAP